MAESSPSHDLMYDTAANHCQSLLILVLSIAITAAINSFFLNFSTSIIISKTKNLWTCQDRREEEEEEKLYQITLDQLINTHFFIIVAI